MWKRVLIVIIAGWVLFSGYAWPHTRPNLVNNWIVGLGFAVFGTLSVAYAWARNVTLALAVWLFAFSLLFQRHSAATFWNNAMIAVVVAVLSLVSSPSAPNPHHRSA